PARLPPAPGRPARRPLRWRTRPRAAPSQDVRACTWRFPHASTPRKPAAARLLLHSKAQGERLAMDRTKICASIVALSLAACAREAELVPAPDAMHVEGTEKAAFADAAGVRVIVHTDAWHGAPIDLGEVITPLAVVVENGSEHQLRIAYGVFQLVTSSGQ